MCTKYDKDIIMLTLRKIFKQNFMLTYKILSQGRKKGKRRKKKGRKKQEEEEVMFYQPTQVSK